MSTPVSDLLSKGDALLAERRFGEAFNLYQSVSRMSGLTREQRERAELGLAEGTAAGVGQDAFIRFIAWLSLFASLVVAALPLFARGDARLVVASAVWWSIGWGLTGVCTCFLMLRFAELVDRARVTEARLIVLSAKLQKPE